MAERIFRTVADAVELVTRQPMMDQEAEVRMEGEGPVPSLKPGLEKAVLPSRKGLPVTGSIPFGGSAEAARIGLNARNAFDRVQDQVTHRPPAGGVKQGS